MGRRCEEGLECGESNRLEYPARRALIVSFRPLLPYLQKHTFSHRSTLRGFQSRWIQGCKQHLWAHVHQQGTRRWIFGRVPALRTEPWWLNIEEGASIASENIADQTGRARILLATCKQPLSQYKLVALDRLIAWLPNWLPNYTTTRAGLAVDVGSFGERSIDLLAAVRSRSSTPHCRCFRSNAHTIQNCSSHAIPSLAHSALYKPDLVATKRKATLSLAWPETGMTGEGKPREVENAANLTQGQGRRGRRLDE